ncbi:hypothetical protein GS961_19600 [Rhodococcus hoagii]|nr:hypothetical protein [Prescottella equi]NKW24516.1 hypothetical protein [Prescottella equi]
MALTSVALGSSRSSSARRSARASDSVASGDGQANGRSGAVVRAARARSRMYRVGYSVVCVTPTAWI